MRIARFSVGDDDRLGVIVDGGVIDVARHLPDLPTDTIGLIRDWRRHEARLAALVDAPADLALGDVRLLAPIARPGKILCVGLNYADHIAEANLPAPAEQLWFAKAGTGAAGPFDPIELPPVSDQLDYEAELVVVIGRRCRHLPRDRAAEAIFGYCVGNDVSVRDWQTRTSQFFLGKSFDGHAPFGPWLTTADSIDATDLAITATVNGEQRQESRTSRMVFDILDQLVLLSQVMTLEPGDIVFTGTPGGVGMGFKPPKWLAIGDTVRVAIEGLGAIENQVVAGSAAMILDG